MPKLDLSVICEEVRASVRREHWPLPVSAQAVAVLSYCEPFEGEDGYQPENVARISLGCELVAHFGGFLLLDGKPSQLDAMTRIAKDLGARSIIPVNCRQDGNTMTQFQVLGPWLPRWGVEDLVVVTSAYHAPRSDRTGHKWLPRSVRFRTVAVPHWRFAFDIKKMVDGETRRIVEYAEKGYIALSVPKERLIPFAA